MNKIKKILILGGCGLLGKPLTNYLKANNFDVVTVAKNSQEADYNLDVTDEGALFSLLMKVSPDLIINLVAITSVEFCEYNLHVAYKMHVELNDNLNTYCKNSNARILHVSTDHFYDANNSTEIEICPKNVYALTKLMGEKSFSTANAVIIRTNFFGKSQTTGRLSLTDVMYRQSIESEKLNLFDDVYFSPLSISSLSKYIVHIINNWIPGIYNLGSKEGLSKKNFVVRFLNSCGLKNINYKSVSVSDSNLKVARPKDMRMDVTLFENTFNCKLPLLTSEIEIVAGEYCEK